MKRKNKIKDKPKSSAKRKETCKLKRVKSKQELDVIISSVKDSQFKLILAFLRLYITKDWKPLGYTSFKDFLEQQFPELEYDTVLGWVTSAYTAYIYGGKKAVAKYSLNAMRQFRGLSDEQQPMLWKALEQASKEAGYDSIKGSWLTAARVKEYRNTLFGKKSVILAESPEEDNSKELYADSTSEAEDLGTGVNKDSISGEKSNVIPLIPPAQISVQKPIPLITKRIRMSQDLLETLESYDGSVSLAKTLTEFSVKHISLKTLRNMRFHLLKAIREIKASNNEIGAKNGSH